MTYDLEILMPTETSSDVIKNRIADFKKYGLTEIGDHKLRLICLTSKGNDPAILETGWPEGVTVDVVETPYNHVAQRIYYFYDKLIDPDSAKWFMRLDEDSMNDIGGIMKNLENYFDPDREYHIGGEFNFDYVATEYNILKSLGFGWWFDLEIPPHEHEVSITSQAAMKRIFSTQKAKDYFRLRHMFADGHGDHGLCFAARMSKIYHTSVRFLSREPYLIHYSKYGGKLNHIHWIGRDKNPQILGWIEACKDAPETIEKLSGSYVLTIDNGHTHWIRLNKNKLIEPILQDAPLMIPRTGLWGTTADDRLLLMLPHDEKKLMIFDQDEDVFTFTGNAEYTLRKMG